MDRWLRILFENPFLLLVLLAWIGGAIANAVKATKRARERAEQAKRPAPDRRDEARVQRTSTEPTATEPRQTESARSAEDVAAEMRRILGMEEPVPRASRRTPARSEGETEASPAAPARRSVHRDVVLPERAPRPVVPTTQSRSLDIHVQPHVGDAIRSRHLSTQSTRSTANVGNLGGRVREDRPPGRRSTSRWSIDDLKKAFVVNEILGPPLSLRGTEDRLR